LASICELIGPMSRPNLVGAKPKVCPRVACWNVCPARGKVISWVAELGNDNMDDYLVVSRLCFCPLRYVETSSRSDYELKSARSKIGATGRSQLSLTVRASAMGQKRWFGRAPTTSDLRRSTDIARAARLVRSVAIPAARTRSKNSEPLCRRNSVKSVIRLPIGA
jgi:hypothetical protein